jgi:membrane-associated phospholipid phosphatase
MNSLRLHFERQLQKQLSNPFERLSAVAYALLAAEFVVGFFLVAVLGFTVAPVVWTAAYGWPPMLAGALMMRRLGWTRVATAVECFGLTYAMAWGSFLVLIPLAAISAPFADPALHWADQAIAFDFLGYARMMRPYVHILGHSYQSYHWQPLLIIGVLAWTGRTERCWAFVTSGAVALAITMAIFPFFPAEGPFVYYGLKEYGPVVAPWQFGPVLQALKDGARHIDYSLMTGLVSLPSYHAAAACIFVWATWPTVLRWVLVPLNTLLLLGTIVIGSHYLVDVIAGVAVAIGSIAITVRLLRPRPAAPEAQLMARPTAEAAS